MIVKGSRLAWFSSCLTPFILRNEARISYCQTLREWRSLKIAICKIPRVRHLILSLWALAPAILSLPNSACGSEFDDPYADEVLDRWRNVEITGFVTLAGDVRPTETPVDSDVKTRIIGKHKILVPKVYVSGPVIYALTAPEVSYRSTVSTLELTRVLTVFLIVTPDAKPGFIGWRERISFSESRLAPAQYREDLKLWEVSLRSTRRPHYYVDTPSLDSDEGTLINCAGPPLDGTVASISCEVLFQVKPDVYVRYRFFHRWVSEWHAMHRKIRDFVDSVFVGG